MSKTITVFGAGMMDPKCKEYEESVEIGRIVARSGHTLVNGGYGGVMKASAQGASKEGGQTIGYTCHTFKNIKANEYIKTAILCSDIFDRLKLLINFSDVFIVQVGGIGTLTELFLVLDEARKKDDPPKIYLIGNHWQWIFDHPMIQKSCKKLLTVVHNVEQLNLLL